MAYGSSGGMTRPDFGGMVGYGTGKKDTRPRGDRWSQGYHVPNRPGLFDPASMSGDRERNLGGDTWYDMGPDSYATGSIDDPSFGGRTVAGQSGHVTPGTPDFPGSRAHDPNGALQRQALAAMQAQAPAQQDQFNDPQRDRIDWLARIFGEGR